MSRWTPILQGEAAAGALQAVDTLAARLMARPFAEDDYACDLMRGDVGIAVFLAHYAQVTGDERASARAGELLERAIERVGNVDPSFFVGMAGTAWAVEHLRDMFGVEPDLDDEVDAGLIEIMDAKPEWLGYELLHGVTGYGVYALERLPSGGRLLSSVVDALARMAEHRDDQARWRCPPWLPLARNVQRFPDGCFPLDPAHGALGPIGVLAGCALHGVPGARELATESVRWVFAQRLAFAGGPLLRQYSNEPIGGLAWCRGDPGAAGVLSAVGDALNETVWTELAVEAARRVALGIGVLPLSLQGGLCHGLAGIAHILARVGQRARDEQLVRVAAELIESLVRADVASDADASLLTGSAGIGLAFLAAACDADPAWDRALLLSFRR